MSKVISAAELLDITRRIIDPSGDLCDDPQAYVNFLEKLSHAITDVCGGEVVSISCDDNDGLGTCVHFGWDENVPEDGVPYSDYDTDVSIEEWREDALGEIQASRG